jgi:hypothetical protein
MNESGKQHEVTTRDIDGVRVVVKRAIDARAADSLRYEGEVLTRINHPGIVRFIADASELNETSIATAAAGDADLATSGPETIEELARVASSLATTLAELHRMGWAHGSIIPEHVVVGPLGRVTLCSLRKATRIEGARSPAATRDAEALADLIEALITGLPTAVSATGRDMTGRVAASVAALRSNGAVSLGDVTDRLAGPSAASNTTRAAAEPGGPVTGGRGMRRPASRPSRDRSGVGAALGTMVLCAVALAALWFLRPAIPSLTSPTDSGTAVRIAVGLLWSVTSLIAFAGLLLHGAIAVALWRDSAALAAAVERVAPPRLRRSLAAVAAAGVTLSSISAVAVRATDAPRASVGQVFAIDSSPSTTPGPSTMSVTTTPAADIEPGPPAEVEAPPVAPSPEWVVERGDHLWHIAESTLTTAWGRPPTDAETAPYWRSVIETNRSRLVDHDNPDLITIGQRFALPPAPTNPFTA